MHNLHIKELPDKCIKRVMHFSQLIYEQSVTEHHNAGRFEEANAVVPPMLYWASKRIFILAFEGERGGVNEVKKLGDDVVSLALQKSPSLRAAFGKTPIFSYPWNFKRKVMREGLFKGANKQVAFT